jgi:hypothetical protein
MLNIKDTYKDQEEVQRRGMHQTCKQRNLVEEKDSELKRRTAPGL